MRVTQARRSNASQETRSTRARSAGGGRFQLPNLGPAQARAEAAMPAAAAVSGVGTIVALQAIEEPSERRRRAVETGDKILDLLEKLKVALLSGEVSANDLDALKRTIGRQLDLESDPALNEILKQIDLRARVELAKITGNRAGVPQSRKI